MELIADGLLLIAAVTASLYCIVLSRRLRRLTQMEDGIGKAISDMSFHVEEMNHALARAKSTAAAAAGDVDTRLAAARAACARLEAATVSAKERAAALEQAVSAAPTPSVEADEPETDMSYAGLVDDEIADIDDEPVESPKATPRNPLKTKTARGVTRAKVAPRAPAKPAARPVRVLPRAPRESAEPEVAAPRVAIEERAPVAAPRIDEAAPRKSDATPAVAAALGAALSARGEGDHEALARRLIAALSGGAERTSVGT